MVDAVQVTEDGEVRTAAGVLQVKAGDWLVRDPQGNLVRCDDINFKCTYELFENSARLEEFHEGKSWGC